jgi:hypothetical protein
MGKPAKATRPARAPRRDGTVRVRELVALIGSLSRTGDVITLDAISKRLGLRESEARTMMDIICSASGEQSVGLLISANEEQTEFTLQYPGCKGRPVRLTRAETAAVMHGLDLCGIGEDDPLRQRVSSALASPEVSIAEIRRALGEGSYDENLMTCVWAQVEERVLSFDYKGARDEAPRRRHVLVRSIRRGGNTWHVRAFDTVIRQDRTFRLDRMTDAVLGEVQRIPQEPTGEPERRIGIQFATPEYYHMFPWPGIRVLSEVDGIIRADIPYFGEHSDWLVCRLAACEGTVTVDDASVMERSRAWALELLSYAPEDV